MNNYYRMDGWVKTALGPAVPGAPVYVCTQPANVFPPITPPKTLPVQWAGPNPQAPIFSDAGLTPIIQPIFTDGFGHYDFYALPGLYTIVVLFGGKVQQFYVDQSLGNAGSTSTSPLVLSTNGTPNFNQTNLNFIQGAGIVLSTDNFGNMTITGSSITFPGDATQFLNGTGVFSVPPSTSLQVNGTPNGSETLLNLAQGAGITVVDEGSGQVMISSTVQPGGSFTTGGFFESFAGINDAGGQSATAVSLTKGGSAETATNNQVICFQLLLKSQYNIQTISFFESGAVSGHASCAIYSSDGTTRLLYAGANAFDTSNVTTRQTVTINGSTGVTLLPGQYWFACSATSSSANSSLGASLTSGAAGYATAFNLNRTRAGISNQTMSGGGMPSGLGVISAISTGSIDCPGFFFEG